MTNKIVPQEATDVHIVSSGKETKGWVHTHGLSKHGLPELEIRGVPLFLADDAVRLINDISDYLLNSGKEVKVGQTMQLGPMCIIRFQTSIPIIGDEEHFKTERWEIVDAMTGRCDEHKE